MPENLIKPKILSRVRIMLLAEITVLEVSEFSCYVRSPRQSCAVLPAMCQVFPGLALVLRCQQWGPS